MARKVFISFLGATNYDICDYHKNGQSYGHVRFIQEATLRYLNKEEPWTNDDIAYILLTKGAESNNWIDGGHIDKKTNKALEGLKSRLDVFSIQIEPINNIPDGNTEDEIWEIFNRIFEKIQNDDTLFFDLTHGYRYLPMLMIVLGNYAKFLKNVSVRSITYGNYEVSEKGTKPGQIMDLLPLSTLQDWTYAAGQFLDSGNVEKLVTLGNNSLKPLLSNKNTRTNDIINLKKLIENLYRLTDDIVTCRGLKIINSKSVQTLTFLFCELPTTFIKPFNPILEKIKLSIEPFDKNNNINNCYTAAEWCYDHGMYQPSATLLQEGVVSFFCKRHSFDITDEEKRNCVNNAFSIKVSNQPEEKWKGDKILINELLNDDYLNDEVFVNLFRNLTETRNDFLHSGMRSKRQPQEPSNIKSNIEKCLCGFKPLFTEEKRQEIISTQHIFINLSNHPSSDWDIDQIMAAKIYGNIIDLPFPTVDPQYDESDIEGLANDYYNKVKKIASSYGTTIHIMGEMSLTFALIKKLQGSGYNCIASTTERCTIEHENGNKESSFHFVKFREYERY